MKDKLSKIASPTPSRWREQAEARIASRDRRLADVISKIEKALQFRLPEPVKKVLLRGCRLANLSKGQRSSS